MSRLSDGPIRHPWGPPRPRPSGSDLQGAGSSQAAGSLVGSHSGPGSPCPDCGDHVSEEGFGRLAPEWWDGLLFHRGCVTRLLVQLEETT